MHSNVNENVWTQMVANFTSLARDLSMASATGRKPSPTKITKFVPRSGKIMSTTFTKY